ncbi:NAD(P)H-quinone oxidoreductase subunit L [Crocosphaera sp. UHCC 0190]|uniref:NAD(P)H-quinone oxidoreductase subunit L n=1 Tax=Crocosphaera sp. UHCC 0190 TaxID=3110246 RepID=UPI003A521B17
MDITALLSQDTLLVALLYLSLSVLYLLVMPGLVYFYLNSRWYVVSSFERAFMYFLMFFFFPGMLLLSPFLNFRPKRRQLNP